MEEPTKRVPLLEQVRLAVFSPEHAAISRVLMCVFFVHTSLLACEVVYIMVLNGGAAIRGPESLRMFEAILTIFEVFMAIPTALVLFNIRPPDTKVLRDGHVLPPGLFIPHPASVLGFVTAVDAFVSIVHVIIGDR